MLNNYLKIAFRNLYRNRIYLLINTLGLGIALACCIIAYLNYSFDQSFDTFHDNKDALFRVTIEKESNNLPYGISPLPLATKAMQDIPGVEQAVRLFYQSTTVKKEDNVFNEQLLFVDSDFLNLFTFDMVAGSKEELADRNNILLTEETAKKYFGEEDPIGQSITIYAGEDHQLQLLVGGVVEDPPLNGSIRFDFLLHIDQLMLDEQSVTTYGWDRFVDLTFLKLKESTQLSDVETALNNYTAIHNNTREDWKINGFQLQPFTESAQVAETGLIRADYLGQSLPQSAVWGPIVLAILLFITACLNLTNTTVSLSNQRLKEIGVRRVMGGTRKQVMLQLLSESFLVTLMGLIMAVIFTDLLLPAYNRMWPFLELEVNYFTDYNLVLFLVLTLLLTGLIAGAYPAFYISSFNPVNIFRGKVKFGGSNLFSRMLLGIQVMISLISVIGGISFARNAAYQKKADMGYDRSGVVGVYVKDEASYQTLRDVAEQDPKIVDLAGTHHHLGYSMRYQELESQGEMYESLRMDVGAEYLEMMDVRIADGRAFDPELETDRTAALVNQKLMREFGWEEPIGRQFILDSVAYTVVGVVEDFFQTDFFAPIRPVVLTRSGMEKYRYVIAKTSESDLVAVQNNLKAQWRELFPFRPYQGFYQDELLAEELLISQNIKVMFLFLAVVTILLTAVGLFALVSLNILKRLKEIAIRRIVGASLKDIIILVNKNYFWIFLVALVAGSYGGSFLTQMIMGSIFALHVSPSLIYLLLVSLSFLLLAGLTIAVRIIKVVRLNPAEVIRRDN